MDIKPESVSIDVLLKITLENQSQIAEAKGLLTSINVCENLPIIATDESRLYQVFSNIINNAIKFTFSGSVAILVTQNSEHVFVEVKDTGIGISEQALPIIFDEFRQVDGTSSRKYEGTGLGLSIARSLINMLGGSISVKSKLGEGSLFTIAIPKKWHLDSD